MKHIQFIPLNIQYKTTHKLPVQTTRIAHILLTYKTQKDLASLSQTLRMIHLLPRYHSTGIRWRKTGIIQVVNAVIIARGVLVVTIDKSIGEVENHLAKSILGALNLEAKPNINQSGIGVSKGAVSILISNDGLWVEVSNAVVANFIAGFAVLAPDTVSPLIVWIVGDFAASEDNSEWNEVEI